MPLRTAIVTETLYVKLPVNELYAMQSPCMKVALSIYEQGITKLEKGEHNFTHTLGISWLSKLARDLEGQVSRVTIDQCLDSLLDRGIIAHGENIMQKVTDLDGTKWVRAYHIGNEFSDKIGILYKITHEISEEQRNINGRRKSKL